MLLQQGFNLSEVFYLLFFIYHSSPPIHPPSFHFFLHSSPVLHRSLTLNLPPNLCTCSRVSLRLSSCSSYCLHKLEYSWFNVRKVCSIWLVLSSASSLKFLSKLNFSSFCQFWSQYLLILKIKTNKQTNSPISGNLIKEIYS